MALILSEDIHGPTGPIVLQVGFLTAQEHYSLAPDAFSEAFLKTRCKSLCFYLKALFLSIFAFA